MTNTPTQDAHTLGELTVLEVAQREQIAILTERLHQAERERDEARAHVRAEMQNEMDVMRVTISSQKEWIDGLNRKLKDQYAKVEAATQRASVLERRLEDARAALLEISELDLEGDASFADAVNIAAEALDALPTTGVDTIT